MCNKCGSKKSIDDFEFRKDKNSYRNICKECRNKQSRLRYSLNKDKINEKRRNDYNKHKDEINAKRRETYSYNKDRINVQRKNRNKENIDPFDKLKKQVYNAICKSYERKGFTRTKSVEELLGMSLDEYVTKMLKLYEYSSKRKWDGKEKLCVDHVIPIWSAETVEELDRCNRALQFLTEVENRRKGGKISNGIGKNGKVIYSYFDPKWFK